MATTDDLKTKRKLETDQPTDCKKRPKPDGFDGKYLYESAHPFFVAADRYPASVVEAKLSAPIAGKTPNDPPARLDLFTQSVWFDAVSGRKETVCCHMLAATDVQLCAVGGIKLKNRRRIFDRILGPLITAQSGRQRILMPLDLWIRDRTADKSTVDRITTALQLVFPAGCSVDCPDCCTSKLYANRLQTFISTISIGSNTDSAAVTGSAAVSTRHPERPASDPASAAAAATATAAATAIVYAKVLSDAVSAVELAAAAAFKPADEPA